MKKELEYSKMLESAGFSREQAETHLRVIEGAMRDNVATKLDLYELRSDLQKDIYNVQADVQNLSSDMGLLEQRLINKLGLMIATTMAIMGGLATFLKFTV